jgi:dGTPase
MMAQNLEIKAFLHQRMYRHSSVTRSMSKARRLMKELFALFLEEPELLPEEWLSQCISGGPNETARIVCDYIAGMTDRFAIAEYRRLFDIVDELA